jgi:fibronectin type 3 domain-containing protein
MCRIHSESALLAWRSIVCTVASAVVTSAALTPAYSQTASHGLNGNYFSNTSLSGTAVLKRVDSNINFQWPGSPGTGVPTHKYSVRWTGYITPTATGKYSLILQTDAGGRLYLNNSQVISDWGPHTLHAAQYNVTLTKNQKYPLKVEFQSANRAAAARFYWIVPGQSVSAIVPSSVLTPDTTTAPAKPGAPSGLSATGGNAKVSLSWTAASGATSYQLSRSTTNNGPYTAVGSAVTTTSGSDSTVTNGKTYYYVVTATNSAGVSPNSNQASATPTAPAKPGAPSGLSATGGNASVSLSWTAVSGATSYQLSRSTTKGGPYTSVGSAVTTTSSSDATVTNGTTYYYVVTATNSAGTSPNSNEASATPKLPAPGAPTSLSATGGNASVSLSWTAASGATSYQLSRSTTKGGPYTAVGSAVTTTSGTDSTVTNGTTYYYVVTATNSGGTSPNSNEASAIPTAPAPPSNVPQNLAVTATWNSTTSTPVNQCSWSSVTSATGYRLYTVSGTTLTLVMDGISGTTYSDTKITSGQTYTYVVTSTSSAGESAPSSSVTVTAASAPSKASLQFLPGGPLVSPGITQMADGSGNTFLCPGPVGQKFTPTTPINFMGGTMPLGIVVPPTNEFPQPYAYLTAMWRIETPACDQARTTISCPGPGNGFVLDFYDYLGQSYAAVVFTPNSVVDKGTAGTPVGVSPFAVDITKNVLHATLLAPRSMIFSTAGLSSRNWLSMYISDVNALFVDVKDVDGDSLANMDWSIVKFSPDQASIENCKIATKTGVSGASGDTTWHNQVYDAIWMNGTNCPNWLPQLIRGGDPSSNSYASLKASDGSLMNVTPSGGNPNHRYDMWVGFNSTGQQRIIIAEDGILVYDTGYLPVADSISIPSGKATVRFVDNLYHTALRVPDTNEVDTWTNCGVEAEPGFPATTAFPMKFN